MSALGRFGRFTLFSPRVSHSNTCRLLSFVCFVFLFGFVALVCFCFLFCECLGIPNSPRSLDLDDRQGLIARSAMQQKKKWYMTGRVHALMPATHLQMSGRPMGAQSRGPDAAETMNTSSRGQATSVSSEQSTPPRGLGMVYTRPRLRIIRSHRCHNCRSRPPPQNSSQHHWQLFQTQCSSGSTWRTRQHTKLCLRRLRSSPMGTFLPRFS